ncbi:MAG: HAD hydrolase-like protein, partial [Ignavibacteriaceae bacterium]|nr:HAD hydrolase-like protein [Ignavibacteriaceae bacterium]
FNEIINRLKPNPEKTILIGDRLETDIAMGNKFGIDTALVETGVKHFVNGLNGFSPTYQLKSVFDIINRKI